MNIDVLITGARRMQRIHKRFLKQDHATDVIAFRSDPVSDIVVSSDFAKRYSRQHGIPYKEELARYLVHGTLHLLGYDDRKKKDFERMHSRQERILSTL